MSIRFLITNKAFTLIEMLIVIGIISLIASTVMFGINRARYQAKVKKAKADISEIAKSIDLLALDTGEWPGHQTPYVVCSSGCSSNEIEDLSTAIAGLKQTDGSYTNWNGPYIQVLTKDPWGHNYFFDTDYTLNGEVKAVVGSYGANGVGLNLYDSDDIVYIVNR